MYMTSHPTILRIHVRAALDLRDVDAYPQAEPVYNATYYEGVEAEFKG